MKVTEELFKTIKQTKVAPAKLSARTVKNILNSKNYSEYRNKYQIKKGKQTESRIEDIISRCGLTINNDMADYYFLLKNQVEIIFRIHLISLIVTIIGFTVLIAMLAW